MSNQHNESGNWLQRIFGPGSDSEYDSEPETSSSPVPAGPPGRAFIYTRPQRNEKGELVDDNGNQVDRCQEYARVNGYRVTRILQEDEHGPDDERDELKALRTAMWKRQFDILITPRPETLYYDTNRLVSLTRELSMLDARLEFVDVDLNSYELDEDRE